MEATFVYLVDQEEQSGMIPTAVVKTEVASPKQSLVVRVKEEVVTLTDVQACNHTRIVEDTFDEGDKTLQLLNVQASIKQENTDYSVGAGHRDRDIKPPVDKPFPVALFKVDRTLRTNSRLMTNSSTPDSTEHQPDLSMGHVGMKDTGHTESLNTADTWNIKRMEFRHVEKPCQYGCVIRSNERRSMKTHTGDLDNHVNIHTCEKPYKCSTCTYKTEHQSNLRNHLLVHTGEKPFKCTVCRYRCALKSNLNIHMRTHTGEKPYKCLLCSYICSQKCHLKEHEKIHTGEKPYKCSFCSHICSRKSSLKEHQLLHTGEKPYKCLSCSFSSAHRTSLYKHSQTRFRHHEKPHQYGCIVRSKEKGPIKTLTGDLDNNIKFHTCEKPYKCSTCSFSTAHQRSLQKHLQDHTAEKPYKCSSCTYKTEHQSNLRNHLLVHTGEKPFKCTVCRYRCTLKSNLNIHMRTHTGEKPYKCFLCSYICSQKSHMKEHEKIHTGEKPYKCSFCSHRCSRKSSMKEHQLLHTGEKPYKCLSCSFSSAHRTSLYKHSHTHTGDKNLHLHSMSI